MLFVSALKDLIIKEIDAKGAFIHVDLMAVDYIWAKLQSISEVELPDGCVGTWPLLFARIMYLP